jgi:hypothetical protein
VATDERDLVAGAPAQGEEVSAAAAGCRGGKADTVARRRKGLFHTKKHFCSKIFVFRSVEDSEPDPDPLVFGSSGSGSISVRGMNPGMDPDPAPAPNPCLFS